MSDANDFWLRKLKMKMPCLKLVPVVGSKVSKWTCVDNNDCTADNLNSCHKWAICSNIPGSYQCACNTSFTGHNTGFTGHLVGLTMTNVTMVTITAMLVTLVRVTMMIALISTNVLPIPKNVTMFPPVPITSLHTSVLAWRVITKKELDLNVPTLTNEPLVHTPVLVI